VKLEEGMSEAKRLLREFIRSTELRMGSHGMRTHLASLTIPPQLGRTDSQSPSLETARICNIASHGLWYIIFLGFV
jgi:hypothetical protein